MALDRRPGRVRGPGAASRVAAPLARIDDRVRIRALYVLIGATESSWVPFSALFLRSRGFHAGEIGATLAAMALAGFLSGPWWGLFADRRLGHERTLTLLAGGAVPFALVVWLVPGGPALAVACVAMWAWKAPQIAIADAVALGRLGGRREGYGSIRLWLSGGYAVAVVCWGAVLQVGGAGLAPLIYASMLALVALVSTQLPRASAAAVGPPDEAARTPQAARRSLVALGAFLSALFLLQAGFFGAQGFFALRIVELGGGAFLVGLGNALQAAVEVPVMAWTSRRSVRVQPIHLFATGCVLWMIVFGGWATLSSVAGATLVNLVGGVAFALTSVSSVVIVDSLIPLRFRATGQTVARAVGAGLAPVVGLAVGGVVYESVGSAAMFALTAASVGCAAIIAGLVVTRAAR